MTDLSARLLERIKWGRSIPAEVADRIEAKLREWLASGVRTSSCTFPLMGDDLWSGAVVEHLAFRGWSVTGERRKFPCACDEHKGAPAPSDFYTVTVKRPEAECPTE
jgi:hypothetical protein